MTGLAAPRNGFQRDVWFREGSEMSEIRIDGDKALRMIAQILRDEEKMLPAEANRVAGKLCSRLSAAMAAAPLQTFSHYRLISQSPPNGNNFKEAVAEKIADVNDRVAYELWRMVFDRCEPMPPGVADAAW